MAKAATVKLRECPFCGREAALLKGCCPELDLWRVVCLGCMVQTEITGPDYAVKVWNRRTRRKAVK